MKQTAHFFITVIGQDRPGIVASVTRSLSQAKCNLEDMTMTILEGEFCMMMIVKLAGLKSRKAIETNLQKLAHKKKLKIHWQAIQGKLKRGDQRCAGTTRYIVNVIGRDQTGIVSNITDYLANKNLNITDLNSRILGKGKASLYALVLEMDVPRRLSAASIEGGLKRIAKRLKVDLTMHPFERLEL